MSLVNDVDLRADGWVVVVPAKGGDKAKSRLTAPRGTQRHTLAAAFALDTVAAALAAVGTGRVYAVTGPGPLVALLEALGTLGVFVRKPGVAPQDRCIRITVGRPAELDLLRDPIAR